MSSIFHFVENGERMAAKVRRSRVEALFRYKPDLTEEYLNLDGLLIRTRVWKKNKLVTKLIARNAYFIELEFDGGKMRCISILRIFGDELMLDGGSIVFYETGLPHTFTLFEKNSPIEQFVWNRYGEKESRHFVTKQGNNVFWQHKRYRQKNSAGRIASFNHFGHRKTVKGQFLELMGWSDCGLNESRREDQVEPENGRLVFEKRRGDQS
jgi:hypothetical protein